jgi:dihydroxyacetone kinase-like predicted kinase
MHKYCLEFILNMQNDSMDALKNSIIEFGQDLEVFQLPQDNAIKGRDFKVRIHTEDPTIIFDTCAQFGRLKSIKVD